MTAPVVSGDNRFVVRGVLFALLLCLSGWTALAQVAPDPSARVTTGIAPADCSQSDDAQSTGNSDTQWHARHRANTLPESHSKIPLVRAQLLSARADGVFVEESRNAVFADCATRHVAAHLLNIPLLI